VADGFAVGLVLVLAWVGVAVAGVPGGGVTVCWGAWTLMPSAVAEAQSAASGAFGCGPGLALAGTLILAFPLMALFLAAVASRVR
jgi:hypothetical protein